MESALAYVPRDPRAGVLHPLVEQWWPRFVESVEADDGVVPDFVRRAVGRYLGCGIPENGFIRLQCPDCGAERALAFSCKVRGLCPSCGARRSYDVAHHLVQRVLPDVPIRQYVLSPPSELVGLLAARGEALSALGRIFVEAIFSGIRRRIAGEGRPHCGAILFVQRFNKAVGLFPHLHVLALDGAYIEKDDEPLDFVPDAPLAAADVRGIEDRVLERFARWLSRRGYLVDDPTEPDALDAWWSAAAREPSGIIASIRARRTQRFEVHARVCVAAGDAKGKEQLCRYVARPPLAEAQLELLDEERVRLTFRSPMRSGQRDLILHPLALMRRIAWQVPPPGQHQLRYAGLLAPAARLRPAVVPAGRVSVQGAWFGARPFVPPEPVPYRIAWAKLIARTYGVDGHACSVCSGKLRLIGAVLPPEAEAWIKAGKCEPLATGPPQAQLTLPVAL